MSISNVLFDLDGTLTDPVEGITRCISHSLEAMGMPSPPMADLACCVGPSLRNTFARLLGKNPGDSQVERAVGLYRERFVSVGLFENCVYPGVPRILEVLRKEGFELYIATSKPRVFAVRICEHFGFHRQFSGIYGPELNGWFDDKGDLLTHLLSREGITGKDAVMVGDREYDIIAARKSGIRSIGVTYGYGSEEELINAGADLICHSPAAVIDSLLMLAKAGK
jgi:phosphoglycolate phosphatase